MTTVSRRAAARLIPIILALAAVYWLWFGLTQRSIIDDEGMSILAAQGILEHGVQRLPSGNPYHRGYVPHHMLAGSIYVFGANDFAIMLPSLLMALGSLWLVYLFAKNALGRPWVGVAAAAILLVLQIQTFYATSPRMYMALQFFTMVAAYAAWRGYIQEDAKFKLIALLAMCAALLSMRGGAGIVVAIPISVLIVMRLKGRSWPGVSFQELVGMLLVGAVVFFLFWYEPPGKLSTTVLDAGQMIDRVGLNRNPTAWAAHLLTSGQALPYAVSFVPIALLILLKSAGRRWHAGDYGLIYAVLIFAISSLLVIAYVKVPGGRFWLNVMPVYALAVCASAAGLIESFGPSTRRWLDDKIAVRGVALWLLVLGGVTVVGMAYTALGFPRLDLVKKVVDPPCLGQARVCAKSIEAHYERLRLSIEPGDLIISSNPWVTNYYLGRVDGFLRERVAEGNTYTAFDFPTDEYFGVPVIDSLGELDDLARYEKRVWVITDPKVEWASSEETREFLRSRYARFHQDGIITTYVNCVEPPCGLGGGS